MGDLNAPCSIKLQLIGVVRLPRDQMDAYVLEGDDVIFRQEMNFVPLKLARAFHLILG